MKTLNTVTTMLPCKRTLLKFLVSGKKEKKKKTENFEFSLNVRQGFRNNDSVDVKRLNNCRKTEFFYEKVFTNKVIFLYNKYVHIEIRNTIRTTLD
jgi:hypothetical protein